MPNANYLRLDIAFADGGVRGSTKRGSKAKAGTSGFVPIQGREAMNRQYKCGRPKASRPIESIYRLYPLERRTDARSGQRF